MKPGRKFALWLAAFFAATVALVALVGVLVAVGMPADDQAVLARVLDERAPLLGFAALILLFSCAGILSRSSLREWLDAGCKATLRRALTTSACLETRSPPVKPLSTCSAIRARC